MDDETLAPPDPDAEPTVEPESEEREPLDPAIVADWLARLKPAAVLALLKDPDYGLAVSRAFLGFRPDAKGYANPLVRSRLAQIAVKDVKLAEKLRALTEKPNAFAATAPPAPSPLPPETLSAPKAAEPEPDPRAALRAERDQRRHERDEARSALKRAEAERDDARQARQKAETERDESSRLGKRQAERVARLERQVARLHESETQLLKALSQDKVSPPPSSPARAGGPTAGQATEPLSPWLTAVRHLLDRGKFDQALALAEDVLKSDNEEATALDIAARALEGKKDPKQAAPYIRRLLARQVANSEIASGSETLQRLLHALREPAEAAGDVRRYLAAFSPGDGKAVEAVRLMLSRLRGLDPKAHAWLADVIASQTTLGPVLMPPPGAISPDDALPLSLGLATAVTARQLAEAVDRGNAAQVDAAREALVLLERADPETHGRIWTALEQAADDDLSRLIPLRRTPRGPILVDGSNVAWFDQESLVNGKPRLRHLREMRRALWTRGFFPVLLYADANLPYFIDEPTPLRAMRDRQELTLVDAGTVADEVLLRMAKHLGAPLVTNDKMEDWDPEGEVPKIRYAISLGGPAHLLSDV